MGRQAIYFKIDNIKSFLLPSHSFGITKNWIGLHVSKKKFGIEKKQRRLVYFSLFHAHM